APSIYLNAIGNVDSPSPGPTGRTAVGLIDVNKTSEGFGVMSPIFGVTVGSPVNQFDRPGGWAPDGSVFLLTRNVGTVNSLFTVSPDNLAATQMVLTFNDTGINDAAWEPYLGTVHVVAPSGF